MKAYGRNVILKVEDTSSISTSTPKGKIVSLGHESLGDNDPLKEGMTIGFSTSASMKTIRHEGEKYILINRMYIEVVY